MSFTGSDVRVLHLHPTRRCNLECVHCYSESGPTFRDTLSTATAVAAVASAARLGYTMLSVSGGEPLMFNGLWELINEARRLGLVRAIVSNGVALTAPLAARLRDAVDVVVVSVDGRPERHNYLRNHPAAFARMQRGLAALRSEGVRFTLRCSVSAESLADLEWAAAFAVEEGASALQIHLIEPAGRALGLPADPAPADTALAAYLIAERLRHVWRARLTIDIDVVDLRPFADHGDRQRTSASTIAFDDLSAVASPLVIEPDGEVVPLRYGFPRAFAIGNLHAASLEDLARRWLGETARPFLAIARDALASAARETCPFGNPYEVIANAAEDATAFAAVRGKRRAS